MLRTRTIFTLFHVFFFGFIPAWVPVSTQNASHEVSSALMSFASTFCTQHYWVNENVTNKDHQEIRSKSMPVIHTKTQMWWMCPWRVGNRKGVDLTFSRLKTFSAVYHSSILPSDQLSA